MSRTRSVILGIGTLTAALGIGFFMQNGNAPRTAATQPVKVQGITPTSSASGLPVVEEAAASDLPALPKDALAIQPENPEPIRLAAIGSDVVPDAVELPAETASPGFDCEVTMTATPAAGAMVDLSVNAPCYGSESVTLHHNGLMISEITQPDGTLRLSIPALSETAVFILAFNNGEGAMAKTEVTSLPFYDRVAVQWQGGESGLQLHAREFGAEYWSDGHVWQDASGDLTAAARGEGGFLTRLGRADTPEGLMAQVYSYPAGTTQRDGKVLVSVEAEVTAQNCNKDVSAQTLELTGGGALRVQDLNLAVPACDAVGDFLVLKNLIDDLTIARN